MFAKLKKMAGIATSANSAVDEKQAAIGALIEQKESKEQDGFSDDEGNTNANDDSSSGAGSDSDDEVTENNQASTKKNRRIVSLARGALQGAAALATKTSASARRSTITAPDSPQTILERRLPAMASLRQAIENTPIVLRIMTSLILENPRFVDLENYSKPGTLRKLEEESVNQYEKRLSAEISGFYVKSESIKQFHLEGLYPEATSNFKLTQDFISQWTRKIHFLINSKDQVINDYVSPQDNAYPFSILPLEKLQHYYKTLEELQGLQVSLQLWASSFNLEVQENQDLLNDEDFSIQLDALVNAVNLLVKTTIALMVTLLSIKRNMELDPNLITSSEFDELASDAEMKSIADEIAKLNLGVDKHDQQIKLLEVRMAALTSDDSAEYRKLDAAQLESTFAVKTETAQRISAEIEALETKIATFPAQLLASKNNQEYRENAIRIEQSEAETALQEKLDALGNVEQAILAIEEDIEWILHGENYIEVEIAQVTKKLEEHVQYRQETLAEVAEKNSQINDLKELQAKRAELAQAQENAQKKAKGTLQRDFQEALKLLKEDAKTLEVLFPSVIHCPSSESDIKKAVKDEYIKNNHENEPLIKTFISSESVNTSKVQAFKLVQNSTALTLVEPSSVKNSTFSFGSSKKDESTFNFELKYKGDKLQNLVISTELCDPDYIPREVVAKTALSVSKNIADSCLVEASQLKKTLSSETQHACHQLKMASAVITESERFALHSLIRATEPSDSLLVQALNQGELHYNSEVTIVSSLAKFYQKLAYQALYFKFINTAVSYDGEERPFFSTKQLQHMKNFNNFLLNFDFMSDLMAEISDEATRKRMQSTLMVGLNMIKNIDSLPDMIDGYFNDMQSLSRKKHILEMPDQVKIKLAFHFLIELLIETFSTLYAFQREEQAKNAKNLEEDDRDIQTSEGELKNLKGAALRRAQEVIAQKRQTIDAKKLINKSCTDAMGALGIILKECVRVQKNFKLASLPKDKNFLNLAVGFFENNHQLLLAGSNFEVAQLTLSEERDQQAAKNNVDASSSKKRSSLLGSITQGVKLAGNKLVGKDNKNASEAVASEAAMVTVTERKITLRKLSSDEIATPINSAETRLIVESLVDKTKPYVTQEETLLMQDFVKHSTKREANVGESEDEYNAYLASKERRLQESIQLSQTLQSIEVERAPDMKDYPQLIEIFKIVNNVNSVLQGLVLENARFGYVSTLPEVIVNADMSSWMQEIERAYALRDTALSQYGDFSNADFSKSQLRQLASLGLVLSKIRTIAERETLIEYLNEQSSAVIAKFIEKVKQLAAVVLQLVFIVLAVKEKMEPTHKLHDKTHAKIDSAWEGYNECVKFYIDYADKNLNALMMANQIECMLPAINASAVADLDASIRTILEPALSLQQQKFTVTLSVERIEETKQATDIVIILQGVEEDDIERTSLCALSIRPAALHPAYSSHQLNNEERAPFSPAKVVDAYRAITKDNVKSVGAEDIIDQLSTLCTKVRDNNTFQDKTFSQEDILLLSGVYGLFYVTAIQIEKGLLLHKGEARSRIAQALNEVSLQVLGINLKAFRRIWLDFIRPYGYASDKADKKKREPEGVTISLVIFVQLALQKAIWTFQDWKKRDGTALFTKDQFAFGIRTNGPLQLIQFDKPLTHKNKVSAEAFGKGGSAHRISQRIDKLKTQIAFFPATIAAFLSAQQLGNVEIKLLGMTALQKFRLACVCVIANIRAECLELSKSGDEKRVFTEFVKFFDYLLKEFAFESTHLAIADAIGGAFSVCLQASKFCPEVVPALEACLISNNSSAFFDAVMKEDSSFDALATHLFDLNPR